MSAIELLVRHPLAEAVGWAILHSLWQVSAIALACAIAIRLARRAAPDVRYAISFVGLSLMLAWPAATALETVRSDRGAFGAETQRARETHSDAVGSSAARALSTSALPERLDAIASARRAPSAPLLPLRLDPLAPYAALAWALGVLLLATRTLGGWYLTQQLRRRYVSAPPDAWQVRFTRLVRRLKVADRVALLESALVEVPTVIGWLKPVVLVPASAFAGLAPHQLEAILAHELAHVRRHDYLANLLQALVETLLFYHPAMWWLSSQARAEREHCCDDLAVSLCGDRVEYARALADLECVRRTSPALALGADGGSLLRRVSRLLGAPASHDQRTPTWVIAASIIGASAALAMTSVSARGVNSVNPVNSFDAADSGTTMIEQAPVAPQAPPAPKAPKAPTGAGAAQVAPAAPSVPSAPSAPAAPAAPAAPSSNDQLTINGESRISHSSPTEKWEARYKGTIELAESGRDIARISPGGYFKVSEGGWFSSRSVELRGTATGIERKSYHGLREQPYDPQANQFLGDMLEKLIRNGFAAKQRVAQLLKRGGPTAVLQAIETLTSDYARKVYYTQLFSQATLDAPTFTRALANAGKQISSDYESAELLIAAAPRAMADPETRRTFFKNASTIDSDYEQRRAITAALKAAPLDSAAVNELLTAAGTIESDYETAELLIAVSRTHALDATTRQTFFAAVNGIGSDYEQRRVLSAVMKGGATDPEVRAELLKSAAGIGSDYERAEFLLQWFKGGGFERSSQDFLAVASGLSSGYERGRVLAAVLEQPQLTPAQLVAVLRSVATMSGDYERSQLLQRAAARHAITGEVRDAYLAAADRLSDGYEKDQTYAALVRAERRTRN